MLLTSLPINPQKITCGPTRRGQLVPPIGEVTEAYLDSLLAQRRLTRRDVAVLQTLDELGALSAQQLTRLYWDTPATARQRLRELARLQLLTQSEPQPEAMKAAGLRPGTLYTLSQTGRLCLDWWFDPHDRRLAAPCHALPQQLAIAEIIVLLTEACRLAEHWHLAWQGERRCQVVQRGRPPVLIVAPDSLVGFCDDQVDRRRFYFLERDLGQTTACVQKLRQYTAYYHSSRWRVRYGFVEFPPVMVITDTPAQVQNLVETVQADPLPFKWVVSDRLSLTAVQRTELLWTPLWQVGQPGQPPQQRALLTV